MEHKQFETDLCFQLGPIPSSVCFPRGYAAWDISINTMLTPAVHYSDLAPVVHYSDDLAPVVHYSDLDTPPPPNEDDQPEDLLSSMTVAPQVYYLYTTLPTCLSDTPGSGVCVSSDLTCACLYFL
jgi:hypothetical protein